MSILTCSLSHSSFITTLEVGSRGSVCMSTVNSLGEASDLDSLSSAVVLYVCLTLSPS